MKDRLLIYALTLFLLFMTGLFADARDFKVAVIDTGIDGKAVVDLNLRICRNGSFDFTSNKAQVGVDTRAMRYHGTRVATLLHTIVNTKKVCLLIYKIYGINPNKNEVFANAIMKAVRSGARVINLSAAINHHSYTLDKAVRFATSKGVKIFVAAMNNAQNLNHVCNIYPQCIKGLGPNFIVVGALDKGGRLAKYSNYGRVVDQYFIGSIPGGYRGTSYSSPIAAGMYIKSLNLDGK